jgi:hypothetical protein
MAARAEGVSVNEIVREAMIARIAEKRSEARNRSGAASPS